ncbi:hypothetical protein CMI37_23555 [Candidatus Pacearchaeota archaeon]|nr:hypothetical protein [Candidatus Pacearchaeota archaeon]|tara:strand:+ start:10836 stop:11624 length:789 start_codon:yes stop_codon:yes gene_type:complete
MAFRTDGSSHRDGIKSEDKNKKLMQMDAAKASAICGAPLGDGYEVENRGGTQHKEDLVVRDSNRETKISHKRKKNISTGSYDWLNTSGHKKLEGLKQLRNSLRETQPSVAAARRQYNEACRNVIDSLSSEDIITIIKEGVVDPYGQIDRISIEAEAGKTIYSFGAKDVPFFGAVQTEGIRAELHGRGRTSRMVRFIDKKGDPLPDFGLRIRVTSNNGIKAMLGVNPKGKNNSSSPVFKIQQDKVHKMIQTIEAAGKLTKTRI